MSEQHSKPQPQITEREQALSSAYLDTLLIMGRCAAEVNPPLGTGVHETLLRLRRRLAFDPRTQALSDAHAVVENTVRDFGRRAKDHADRRIAESSNLLALVTQTADLFAARDRSYLELLREVTRKMQTAVTSSDPEDARRQCERITFALTKLTETFQDDSAISLMQLRQELASYEQRRQAAEELTTIDPVTGLFTRKEVEHRMRQSIAIEKQFCILKLGIHEFSGFEDEHGQAGMNLLMRSAAEKLIEQVRPRDMAGQWDPRTFILLFFDCPLENAEFRAQQISVWLSGDYKLVVQKVPVHADVQLTGAATERQPGEPVDSFLERAQALSPVLIPSHR
jgi:diguanylate cyclase (GGDEF)-like protein